MALSAPPTTLLCRSMVGRCKLCATLFNVLLGNDPAIVDDCTGSRPISRAATRKTETGDAARRHQGSYPMMPPMQRCSENKRHAVNRANAVGTATKVIWHAESADKTEGAISPSPSPSAP